MPWYHLMKLIRLITCGTFLTAVASQYPELIESKDIRGDVLTTGADAGRTFETNQGRPINLVTEVHGKAFFDKIDELLTQSE